MVRSPEMSHGLKKGPWTCEEDKKLRDYIEKHGHGSWQSLPERAGLNRCGKSCRLRWTNYLRPDIKRGHFSPEEEQTIIDLHSSLGNKWAMIAARLPGRTDNEIKNYWNTHLRKKLLRAGIDPKTHQLITATDLGLLSRFNDFPVSWAENLVDVRLLENILRLLSSSPLPSLLFGSNQFSPLELIPSPPTSIENGGISGYYGSVSDAEIDPHAVLNKDFCLPGLIPATQLAGISSYDGLFEASAAAAFSKDTFYDSFPSSSL